MLLINVTKAQTGVTTLSRVGIPSKNLDTLYLLKSETVSVLIADSWKIPRHKKDTLKTPVFVYVNTLPVTNTVTYNNQKKSKSIGTH